MPEGEATAVAGAVAASAVSAALAEIRGVFATQITDRMDRIEDKLDRFIEHSRWVEQTLADHEARIKGLESDQKNAREDRRYAWSPIVNVLMWVVTSVMGVLLGRWAGHGNARP